MYTIKDVADKMNISEHTIRFWAKNNFFPFITRDKNNNRQFTDEDLEWVRIVKCLRNVGVENKAIKQYIDFCLEGDSTIPARYEIILNTKKKALEQFEDLKQQLDILDMKEEYYKNLIANNQNDIYNPINNVKEAEAV